MGEGVLKPCYRCGLADAEERLKRSCATRENSPWSQRMTQGVPSSTLVTEVALHDAAHCVPVQFHEPCLKVSCNLL
jgi:hypothetical protein